MRNSTSEMCDRPNQSAHLWKHRVVGEDSSFKSGLFFLHKERKFRFYEIYVFKIISQYSNYGNTWCDLFLNRILTYSCWQDYVTCMKVLRHHVLTSLVDKNPRTKQGSRCCQTLVLMHSWRHTLASVSRHDAHEKKWFVVPWRIVLLHPPPNRCLSLS